MLYIYIKHAVIAGGNDLNNNTGNESRFKFLSSLCPILGILTIGHMNTQKYRHAAEDPDDAVQSCPHYPTIIQYTIPAL